jgi:hypothetical protein
MSDNPAASSELVTRAWRNWRCFSEGGYLSLVGTVITFFYEEHSNNLFNKVSALMDFASFLRFGGLMAMCTPYHVWSLDTDDDALQFAIASPSPNACAVFIILHSTLLCIPKKRHETR